MENTLVRFRFGNKNAQKGARNPEFAYLSFWSKFLRLEFSRIRPMGNTLYNSTSICTSKGGWFSFAAIIEKVIISSISVGQEGCCLGHGQPRVCSERWAQAREIREKRCVKSRKVVENSGLDFSHIVAIRSRTVQTDDDSHDISTTPLIRYESPSHSDSLNE